MKMTTDEGANDNESDGHCKKYCQIMASRLIGARATAAVAASAVYFETLKNIRHSAGDCRPDGRDEWLGARRLVSLLLDVIANDACSGASLDCFTWCYLFRQQIAKMRPRGKNKIKILVFSMRKSARLLLC